ncbi:MAG TPA: hypothetical protein VF624_15110 [Tepidisphaeraceae bacterium]|jgi:hypothetical protein
MADESISFNREDGRRIASTVRAVESGLRSNQVDTDSRPPPSEAFAVFNVVEPLTGGGKYKLQMLAPPTTDLSPSTDLAAADLGTVRTTSTGFTYVGFYPPELGTAVHGLVSGKPYPGVFHRLQSDGQIFVLLLARGASGEDVVLQMDGGTAGSAASSASWTYTITLVGGTVPLATEVPVQRWYPLKANAAPNGSIGHVVYSNGAYLLTTAPETPVFGPECDEGGV